MVNDSISDFLIRIKNGYLAKKNQVEVPWSKTLEVMAKILVTGGYLKKAKVNKNKFKTLIISLKYQNNKPALTDVKRVSKPGVRHYAKVRKIPYVLSGFGIAILSTPKGLMTDKEARKKNLGGEIICEVW